MRSASICTLFVLLFTAGFTGAAEQTVVLQPDGSEGKDTWISSAWPYLSNGETDTLVVGKGGILVVDTIDIASPPPAPMETAAVPRSRALLHFEMPDLPRDATIVSAELSLYAGWVVSFDIHSTDPLIIGAYPVTAAWDEGTSQPLSGANWYYSAPPATWSRAGGDFESEPAGIDTLSESGVWMNWDLTRTVSGWVASPGGNLGLILAREQGDNGLVSFPSSDHADTALRPKLTITYSTIEPLLPAFTGAVAELTPNEAERASETDLVLEVRFDFEGVSGATGVNRIILPLPGGFAAPSVSDVTVGGIPVSWTDGSGADSLVVDLDSRIENAETLRISFRVTTPGAPDPGGSLMIPYGDDRSTQWAPQILEEGNANGDDTDGNHYRLVIDTGPLASLHVSPSDTTLNAGRTVLFTAAGYDDGGYPVDADPSWRVAGEGGTVHPATGLFTATTPGTAMVIAEAEGVSDTSFVHVYDDAALVIESVVEDRAMVTSGEERIPVALALLNSTGEALSGPAVALRFFTGNGEVTSEYVQEAVPFDAGLIPDGGRDTLRFFVSVGETATSGVTVRIDGEVTATLQPSGVPVSIPEAESEGEWIVGEAPVLVDIGGSLYPGRAHSGGDAGFSIALRNDGGASIFLGEETRLTFTDGTELYEASLVSPVTIEAGGPPQVCFFETAPVAAGFDPGSYTVTLDLAGVDGNGGGFAVPLEASANTLEMLPPWIEIEAPPVGGSVVHPGAVSIPILRVEMANRYDDERRLTALTVTNGNVGPGTTAERDTEWQALRLVEDVDRDGESDPGETVLGSGIFDEGGLVFDGLDFDIAGGDTAALLLEGDLSALFARDGEELNALLSSAEAIVFDGETQVQATYPVDSPGIHFVDGFLATRLEASGGFPPGLPAGADDSLALAIRVPSNGYETDTLRSLTVRNGGTAEWMEDITEVRLWRDGGDGDFDAEAGDDTDMGALFWTGDGWSRSGIGLVLPAGGELLFVTVDASESPVDQRTLRLQVPIDGVLVASSNDGPIDEPELCPSSRVIGGARRIVVGEISGGGGEVLPGEAGAALWETSLLNVYTDTVFVESVRFVNGSSGPNPDSVASRVRLGDGAGPIADAPSVGGAFLLDGFTLPIPPGGTGRLTVAVDVGTGCVADGDTVRVILAAAGDISFRVERVVDGGFPLASADPAAVNGLSAAQIDIHTIEGGTLSPTDGERATLSVTIPADGCGSDTLTGIRVANDGTAGIDDLERLTLYAGGNTPVEIGELVWNGQVWTREGMAIPVSASGETLTVKVVADDAGVDGKTVLLSLPVNALTMVSDNDGPVDEAVRSTATFLISTSPLFASLHVPSEPVTAGQIFTVEMKVRNTAAMDQDGLTNVVPDSFAFAGLPLTLVEGPSPDSIALLDPGEEAAFAWQYSADQSGSVSFTGRAAARRASGGEEVRSFVASSGAVVVEEAPTSLVVDPLSTLPDFVNRGERLVSLMVLGFTHGDGAGVPAAAIVVDTIRVVFEGEGGAALPADSLLRGAVVERGGGPIGIADSASIGHSFLQIPLVEAIRIEPGEEASAEILIDLLAGTEVTSFSVILDRSGSLPAKDGNTGAPVPVAGPFPFQTGDASVVVPPTTVQVIVGEGPPERIIRGGTSVPIIRFDLLSEGITGVTADVAIHSIQVWLTDGLFPFETAEVSGPGITHFSGDGWTTDGALLTFPLDPPVEVTVNNPVSIEIRGEVSEDAPTGLFRLGLEDTLFIDPVSSSDDSGVDVEIFLADPIEMTVVIPTDSIVARGASPSGLPAAWPGERSREAFRVVFSHPGADTLSPVRVVSLPLRLESETGDSVEIRSFLARAEAMHDNQSIASVAPLEEGAATLSIPLSTALSIEPGDSAEIEFRIDLRADAPPGDYRFVVLAGAVGVIDGIGGNAVALSFTGEDRSRYRTDPLPVRRVSERVDVSVDLDLPSTFVGGALLDDAARIGLTAVGGEEEESDLHLESFRIVVEGSDGERIDPESVLRSATTESANRSATAEASFDSLSAVFLFDPPLALAPGEPIELTTDMALVDNPPLSSFRIRLAIDEIVLSESGPAVERADGDGGANPSAWTHKAEKSFDESLRNYPNPFAAGRETTTIVFYARSSGRAEYRLFTGLGVAVARWEQTVDGPGLIESSWDGRNGEGREVLSGAYILSIHVRYPNGETDHGRHKIAVLR